MTSSLDDHAKGDRGSVRSVSVPSQRPPRVHHKGPFVRASRESLLRAAETLKKIDVRPSPTISDLCGNTLPIANYAHPHHPVQLEKNALRWASLVEALLDKEVYGMRTRLRPTLEVLIFWPSRLFKWAGLVEKLLHREALHM